MIVEFTLHNGRPISVNSDHVLYVETDPAKVGITSLVMLLIPVNQPMKGMVIAQHTVDVKEPYVEVIARLQGKPVFDLGASGRVN